MPDNTDFRAWMDSRGLKADDVAAKFDVSPQTISHWRSQGVPERRLSHVRYIMSCWPDTPSAAPPPVIQPLVLTPTRDQFRAWNTAAISHNPPLLVEEWAIHGLDSMADEAAKGLHISTGTAADREDRWQRENSSKVAEDGNGGRSGK